MNYAANFGTNSLNAAGATGDTSWAHLGVILGVILKVILEVSNIESKMVKHIVVFVITETHNIVIIYVRCVGFDSSKWGTLQTPQR